MFNKKLITFLFVLVAIAFTVVNAVERKEKPNKCSLCQSSCQKFKKAKTQEFCLKGCDIFSCGEEEKTELEFDMNTSGYLQKEKCELCNTGCQVIKDEIRRAPCLKRCEVFACKGLEKDEEKEEEKEGEQEGEQEEGQEQPEQPEQPEGQEEQEGQEGQEQPEQPEQPEGQEEQERGFEQEPEETTESDEHHKLDALIKNVDTCKVCKAACQFLKDESRKELCLQGCESFACDGQEEPQQEQPQQEQQEESQQEQPQQEQPQQEQQEESQQEEPQQEQQEEPQKEEQQEGQEQEEEQKETEPEEREPKEDDVTVDTKCTTCNAGCSALETPQKVSICEKVCEEIACEPTKSTGSEEWRKYVLDSLKRAEQIFSSSSTTF